MRTRTPNIIQALSDRALLGQFIKDIKTFASWLTFLRVFFGLPSEPGDPKLFKDCTGRAQWPADAFSEAWLIIGVRGGKSFISALIATYLAVFKEYQLSPGEKGFIIIVAPTKRQARIIKSYLTSFFTDNPFLSPFLARESAEEVELTNNVIIACLSSDYRSLRGYTAIGAIADELSYFSVEGSRPDREVIRSLRGRLLSTGGPLICISTPYARRGIFYETWKKHWGNDESRILVWKAPSTTMNPTLSRKIIDRAIEEDPIGAKADYLAEFRSDIESYVSRKALEACVAPNRFELPYISGNFYKAFVDPAGGSGRDAMALAVCHMEGEFRVLDLVREVRPPFSPEQVVKDFAEMLRTYHLKSVTGDRYGGEWPRERFRVHGITYEIAEKSKSDYYKEFLPLINSGRIELLDHPKMLSQILNLERKTARSGRDSIDHPPNGHDDLANVCAGVSCHFKKLKRAGVWGTSITRSLAVQFAIKNSMEARG
jgi:hypothetical protein